MSEQLFILPQIALDRKRRPEKRGHYHFPGGGPEGETCGTCAHYCVKQMSKSYRKCGKNRANWTGGPGSDIRKRDPACIGWEART